jgi:MYXO-CTERM domain-containing protein
MWVLFLMGTCLSARAADWPRLPTDAELRAAADAATGSIQGRLLYSSGPVPWHDPAHFAAVGDPVAASGAFLALAWAYGGESLSVNGVAVGTSPTKVQGTALRLFYADGDFVFAPMTPRGVGEFRPALEVIEVQALNYALRSEAAVRAHVDRHFTPRPDGYGYVRGFPVAAEQPLPIEVIVGGGVAAVVVAGAALIRRRRARPPAPTDDGDSDSDDDDDDDDVVGHVLQLGRDRIALAPGDTAAVPVSVWRLLANGSVEPEPDATLAARGNDGGVTVSPTSSSGPTMVLSLTAGAAATGVIDIVVTAQIGAGTRAATKEARIVVEVEGGYTMVFS